MLKTGVLLKSLFHRLPALVVGSVISLCVCFFTGHLMLGGNECYLPKLNGKGSQQRIAPAFNFRDYTNDKDLKAFADTHFPVGTPRAYIEAILVNNGGAKSSDWVERPAPKLRLVSYQYKLGGLWDCDVGLSFVFNEREETIYQSFVKGAPAYGQIVYLPYNITSGCTGL